MKKLLLIVLCFTFIKANSQCNNVTYPGEIGINEPIQYGNVPSLIRNIEYPSGGDTTKSIEYIWLLTTDSLTAVGINWNITTLSGYNETYQFNTPIFTKTWVRRCSRRQGCSSYVGETEWIQLLSPNSALPIVIKDIKINNNIIQYTLEDDNIFDFLLLKGGYGKTWKELGIYNNKLIDISKFNYTHYQLYFYDIDHNLTVSKILYIKQPIIEDNSLNGKKYVIYSIIGSVVEKGIYYKCIHLKENQIIRFY